MKNKLIKSQAMVELAILGALVLMTFGILVNYVAKLNNDQYALMQAFRYALAKSHEENKAVSYGTWDDRMMASATSPIVGQKTTSSGAGYVFWAIPSVCGSGEDPQTGMWMKINKGFGEYDISEASSGSVEPVYFTQIFSKVTADSVDGNIQTSRSSFVAEEMLYKIDRRIYKMQARVHGAAR